VTTEFATHRHAFARQVWLGVLAVVLMAGGVLLVLRAMQVDRGLHERYDQALTLAQLSLEVQYLTSRLRGPQTAGAETAAAGAEFKALRARIEALDLKAAERAHLAKLDVAFAAALSAPAGGTDRAASFERVDEALGSLITAVHERTISTASDARRFNDFARYGLMATAALALLLGIGMTLLVSRTLSEHSRRLGQLDQLAHEDGLTGIMNRRGLDERLPIELARAQRLGYPLTVAMLDLDHFKRFNDKRGHGAGDALLRGAAQAWRKQLRPTDLLARYGGEEFTLVLPSCDAEQADQLIDRLRPLMPDRQTFSAGVATWNGEDSTEELLRTADIALLQAKKTGRNRTVIAGREPQIVLPLRLA
jgi:diguanylate cyclase (GGDEF)-like protein